MRRRRSGPDIHPNSGPSMLHAPPERASSSRSRQRAQRDRENTEGDRLASQPLALRDLRDPGSPQALVVQLQRAIGNRAVGRLLSARATWSTPGFDLPPATWGRETWAAGDHTPAHPQRAVVQRKLTKGDNWAAGYSLTGYWSKEQVDAEFVKLADAH